MPDPLPPDDGIGRDEEALFARDYDGRLIRLDAPSLADLGKTVKVRVDGSDWFEVPKAVPATDAQGNILRNPDDTPVVRATTIYDASRSEAALTAGLVPSFMCPVRIPVLCHRDHLAPVGVCRLCSVQIVKPDPRNPNDPTKKRVERKLFPACQHRVEAGMEAHTVWSPEASYRKAIRTAIQVLFELLAADHYHPDRDAALRNRGRKYHNELAGPTRGRDALDRTPAADLEAVLRANWEAFPEDAQTEREQADRDRILGNAPPRFAHKQYRPDLLDGWDGDLPAGVARTMPSFDLDDVARLTITPPFVVDHNNCVLCDRCIRACSDVKPFKVIGRSGKGAATRIAFDLVDVPMATSSCRACGECMTACPTGAITFQYRVMDACPDRLTDLLNGRGKLVPATVVEPNELLAHPLFARMSKAFLEWNRGSVRRREIRPGDVLAQEGEFGTTAYILLPGPDGGEGGLIAVCRKDGKTPRDLPYAQDVDVAEVLSQVAGRYGKAIWIQDADTEDVIGEMSPISHARRNATLIAARSGSILEIDRNVLHILLRDPVNRVSLDNRYALRAVAEFLPQGVARSALFAGVKEEGWVRRFVRHLTRSIARPNVDRTWFDMVLDNRGSNSGFSMLGFDIHPTATHRPIATAAPVARKDMVELARVNPGQVICRAGEQADNFYLIRRGFVEVVVESGPARAPLAAGDCFGEVAVLTALWDEVEQVIGRPVKRGVRTATCIALDHAELILVPKRVFEDFLNARANEAVRDGLRARCAEILFEERPVSDDLTRRYVELGLYQGQELLVLDLEKCTRCDECVKACADSHEGVTRVVRDGPRFGHFLVAVSCRSCHDPYCLTGCPVDAIHREGFTLEVGIDDHCIGCGLCAHNCPYGSIHMVEQDASGEMREVPPAEWPTREEAVKLVPESEYPQRKAKLRAVNCDLCAGSATGPRCVYACPHDAAHRMTGERVLALAEGRRAPSKREGFLATLGRLFRGKGEGE